MSHDSNEQSSNPNAGLDIHAPLAFGNSVDVISIATDFRPLVHSATNVFHTFMADFSIWGRYRGDVTSAPKSITYRVGLRHNKYSDVKLHAKKRYPPVVVGNERWNDFPISPTIVTPFVNDKKDSRMVASITDTTVNFDALLYKTAFIYAASSNAADFRLEDVAPSSGDSTLGSIMVADAFGETIGVGKDTVFIPSLLRSILDVRTIHVLVSLIINCGSNVIVSSAVLGNDGGVVLGLPRGNQLRKALWTIIVGLGSLYDKSDVGDRFIAAVFAGFNNFYTVVGHTDEGGIFRDVMRSYDSAYCAPYGPMFFDADGMKTYFRPVVDSPRNCAKLIFTNLLVGAAFVSVSDPGTIVENSWFPSVSSASVSNVLTSKKEFARTLIATKTISSEAEVDNALKIGDTNLLAMLERTIEKYAPRRGQGDNDWETLRGYRDMLNSFVNPEEDPETLARVRYDHHTYTLANSFTKLWGNWCQNMLSYHNMLSAVSDRSKVVFRDIATRAQLQRRHYNHDTLAPWQWVEPTTILKYKDIVAFSAPDKHRLIYGETGVRENEIPALESAPQIESEGALSVISFKMTALRANPYLFLVNSKLGKKTVDLVRLSVKESEYLVLPGAMFKEQYDYFTALNPVAENFGHSMSPLMSTIFWLEGDGSLPAPANALHLGGDVHLMMVKNKFSGEGYVRLDVPSGDDFTGHVYTAMSSPNYVGIYENGQGPRNIYRNRSKASKMVDRYVRDPKGNKDLYSEISKWGNYGATSDNSFTTDIINRLYAPRALTPPPVPNEQGSEPILQEKSSLLRQPEPQLVIPVAKVEAPAADPGIRFPHKTVAGVQRQKTQPAAYSRTQVELDTHRRAGVPEPSTETVETISPEKGTSHDIHQESTQKTAPVGFTIVPHRVATDEELRQMEKEEQEAEAPGFEGAEYQ